jgi:hypothetical protein
MEIKMEKIDRFHSLWNAAELFLAAICNRVPLGHLSSEGTGPVIFLPPDVLTKQENARTTIYGPKFEPWT